jgi:hypothetical protein
MCHARGVRVVVVVVVKLRELDIVMASSIHACKYEALAGS